jgi:hypothetical protein
VIQISAMAYVVRDNSFAKVVEKIKDSISLSSNGFL